MILSFSISIAFFAGCTFFEKDKNEQSPARVQKTWNGLYEGEYSLEIKKEEKGLYHLYASGELRVNEVPDKITIKLPIYDEKEVEIKTINSVNGYFIITFNQKISVGSIRKGNNETYLTAYSGNAKQVLGYKYTLVADDLYTGVALISDETGECSSGLTKESKWTRNY